MAEAADLIQRRQRSDFQCKFLKCFSLNVRLELSTTAADPDSYSLLNSKYQGYPIQGYKGKSQ